MIQHIVGEVSLSLSASIYLIWLLPQLWHNHWRKSTKGFSFAFHSLLFIGYCFDLMYGFGLHMEWQYRLVTIVGLCSLFIQHLQFGFYNYTDNSLSKNYCYFIVSIIILIILFFSAYTIVFAQHNNSFYNFVGVRHIKHAIDQFLHNHLVS